MVKKAFHLAFLRLTMKKTTCFNLVSALLFAALAALLPLSFASCDDDPGTVIEVPSALRGTQWIHTEGHTVSFTKDSATVTPASGSAQTFPLKDTSYVKELNQTTMYFGSSQTADFITYRNSEIASVGLAGVNRTGGWSIDDGITQTIDSQLIGKWQKIGMYDPDDATSYDDITKTYNYVNSSGGYEFLQDRYASRSFGSVPAYTSAWTENLVLYYTDSDGIDRARHYWFNDGYLYFRGIYEKVNKFSWE